MMNDDTRLDDLFQAYRDACPEPEASVNFMPGVWQKIELRHNFWFLFQRLGRTTVAGCAALCLLLLALNMFSSTQAHLLTPSYTDALMADSTAEQTYYTEAIRTSSTPADDSRK